MKKILALMLSVVCMLSACGETECVHEWAEATCSAPKTCSLCGITEGETLAHSWVEATYEAPKTCSVCGATEGEPLEKPKYTEEELLASDAIVQNQYRFDFLVGSDKKLEYDEENGILHFILTPYSGAADAYSQRGDNWGLYTTYIKMTNAEISFALKSEGFDVPFKITVLDDRDPSKAIFEVQDQNVVTDVYADIVPEELKALAAESAFFTTYNSYDEQHEVTAEFDSNGKILYFFIKLESGVSMLFNSISNAEVQENNFWKSITETVTRWSAQFTEDFTEEGHDVLVVYMLLDGNTVEDAFYCVANGNVVYNAFE
jgi:hypothetical protein